MNNNQFKPWLASVHLEPQIQTITLGDFGLVNIVHMYLDTGRRSIQEFLNIMERYIKSIQYVY